MIGLSAGGIGTVDDVVKQLYLGLAGAYAVGVAGELPQLVTILQ